MTAIIISLLLLIFVVYYQQILCCNEAICSSIVTKCLLLRSCMCISEDLDCHRGCFDCLGVLSDPCCTCLGICPDRDEEEDNIFNQHSMVEDIIETIPGLFEALIEYPDERNRWTVLTFNQTDKEFETNDPDECAVLFISDCTSLQGCRKNCRTMGSIAYRWFYSGCCECVGDNCRNYGLNQSRCINCPRQKEQVDYDYDYDYDDDYDYKD